MVTSNCHLQVAPNFLARAAFGEINVLSGSGPDQKHAFEMRWPKWAVLIAVTTGIALRDARPPKRYVTRRCRRDLV